MRMASYSSARRRAVQRKVPQQQRGERRVAELLEAAEAVIAQIGYEAATMSAIAGRARAAIGSLYQFFPNKACITQALRTEYAKQFDSLYAPLATQARTMSCQALVSHLINLTVRFVDTHPALPALLDAPRSTRAPAAMRAVLRQAFRGGATAPKSSHVEAQGAAAGDRRLAYCESVESALRRASAARTSQNDSGIQNGSSFLLKRADEPARRPDGAPVTILPAFYVPRSRVRHRRSSLPCFWVARSCLALAGNLRRPTGRRRPARRWRSV